MLVLLLLLALAILMIFMSPAPAAVRLLLLLLLLAKAKGVPRQPALLQVMAPGEPGQSNQSIQAMANMYIHIQTYTYMHDTHMHAHWQRHEFSQYARLYE